VSFFPLRIRCFIDFSPSFNVIYSENLNGAATLGDGQLNT
jgi:hypothetical protein